MASTDSDTRNMRNMLLIHPEISKRQTELKVFEVAVKEKQADDTKQVC